MLLRGLIGSVLRRIRTEQARTLKDVADAARVSVPYLSEVERGRKEPSSELLAAICEALGLQLLDLLDEVKLELVGQTLPAARPVTGFTAIHPVAPPSGYSGFSGSVTMFSAMVAA